MEQAIQIPAQGTISQVAGLVATLSKASLEPGPYVLRGGGVERIDTAGLQALVSFRLTVRALGWDVRWDGISDALVAAIGSAGLAEVLGLIPPDGDSWH